MRTGSRRRTAAKGQSPAERYEGAAPTRRPSWSRRRSPPQARPPSSTSLGPVRADRLTCERGDDEQRGSEYLAENAQVEKHGAVDVNRADERNARVKRVRGEQRIADHQRSG